MEKPQKKLVHLFFCVECEDLARKVASLCDSIQLCSINWRNFADGFPHLYFYNAQDIRSQHVAFLASLSSPGMEEEGDVATTFTLGRMSSVIPISRGGPTILVIYDIHALQERFYFGDHVLPCFETGIPLLKQRLQQLPDADNDIGLSPLKWDSDSIIVILKVEIAPSEGAFKHRPLGIHGTIRCRTTAIENNSLPR